MPSVARGGAVEWPGCPHDDRGRQQELPPGIAADLGEARDHGQDEDGQREGRADGGPPSQAALGRDVLVNVTCRVPVLVSRVAAGSARGRSGGRALGDDLGSVSGRTHGGEDVLHGQRSVIPDVRLLGGEVDARGDPLQLAELAFDAGRAGGARHTGDGEVDDLAVGGGLVSVVECHGQVS